MRRTFLILSAILLATAIALPAAAQEMTPPPPTPPSPVRSDGAGGGIIDGSLSVGTTVSSTGVEYPVWEVLDSNGDVVASMTVICTDLTDGSQDCTVKIYEITAGVLTNQGTWP